MQDAHDLNRCCPPVHNHVLIHTEENHVPAGQIATSMTFAGGLGQAPEGVQQLGLNPVGSRQTGFRSK